MAERFGRISYPGLLAYDSFSYTVSHGIQPGVASLVIPPTGFSDDIPVIGDLKVYDGVESFTLKQCRIDSVSLIGGDSRKYQLQILDRRWKWRFTFVNGAWNMRDIQGKTKPFSRKTLEELVKILLEELGEENYEIGDLPKLDDEDLPTVDWDNTNTAQALQSLIDPYGFRVVYCPVRDRVSIAELGKGQNLPNSGQIDRTPSYDLIEVGDPVVATGYLNITAPLLLEPVGVEMNGLIRPIADLSYRPKLYREGLILSGGAEPDAGNWAFIPGSSLPKEDFSKDAMGVRIPDGDEERQLRPGVDRRQNRIEDYRNLALSCVWKYFRPWVVDVFDPSKGLVIDGSPFTGKVFIEDQSQIRLLPAILSLETNSEGEYRTYKPRVYGSWSAPTGGIPLTRNMEIIEDGFSIDSERNLVKFAVPKYRDIGPEELATARQNHPGKEIQKTRVPYLVLLTTFQVRALTSNQFLRGLYSSKNKGLDMSQVGGRNIDLVVRDDLVPVLVIDSDPDDSWRTIRVTHNDLEMAKASEQYIEGLEKKKRKSEQGTPEISEDGVYPGIRAIDPDGAILQISWSLGGGGIASTRMSRNTEHSPWTPTFEVTKRNAELRELVLASGALSRNPEVLRQQMLVGGEIK